MELIKRLDEIQAELKKRFNQLIIETEQEAKRWINANAHDTGDMEDAVTSTPAKEEGGNLVGEIFVDPNQLYIRREPYQYLTGTRKGSYAERNRLYPIYVHQGTKTKEGKQIMKARPFFTIAWEKIKTSEDFRNLAKDILLKHGEK